MSCRTRSVRFENLREHDINQDCARTHLPQPLHCQRLLAGRLTARPNSWQLCWGCLQAADIDVSCAACRSLRGRICGSASKSLLRRGSRSRRRRSTLRTSRRALQNRLCTHVLASEWVLLLAAPRTVAGEARDSTLQTTCAWLHIKLITSRAVCHTCCCARARALMATSLKWPATSCVIFESGACQLPTHLCMTWRLCPCAQALALALPPDSYVEHARKEIAGALCLMPGFQNVASMRTAA